MTLHLYHVAQHPAHPQALWCSRWNSGSRQAKASRGKTERPALPSRVALGAERPAPVGIQNGCWLNAFHTAQPVIPERRASMIRFTGFATPTTSQDIRVPPVAVVHKPCGLIRGFARARAFGFARLLGYP